MHIDEVASIAAQLEGVRESSRGGLRRWDVRGRLVTRQIDNETVVIRSDFVERERLLVRHPETFFVMPRFESHMMVLVDLERADRDAVAAAIQAAWTLQSQDSSGGSPGDAALEPPDES